MSNLSKFDLTPRSLQTVADTSLSWTVHQLRDAFGPFKKLQNVLVRRDTETPSAKRGVVNYWVMSPKDRTVQCWNTEVFKELVYNSKLPTIQDQKYDKLFWLLVEPKLRENQRQRRRAGYVFYTYHGSTVKITSALNTIILKEGSVFTIYKYGANVWSLRSMNKKGKLVDVDGVPLMKIKVLVANSEELLVEQPNKLEQI